MTSQQRENLFKELEAYYELFKLLGASNKEALEMVKDKTSSVLYETEEEYTYVQNQLRKLVTLHT